MLPKVVRVSGYDYEIKLVKGPILVDGRECSGSVEYRKQLIEILDNGTQGRQGQEETWWHEVVHAIARDRGVELEEGQVEALALGLYSLVKNNSYLFPGQKLQGIPGKCPYFDDGTYNNCNMAHTSECGAWCCLHPEHKGGDEK